MRGCIHQNKYWLKIHKRHFQIDSPLWSQYYETYFGVIYVKIWSKPNKIETYPNFLRKLRQISFIVSAPGLGVA